MSSCCVVVMKSYGRMGSERPNNGRPKLSPTGAQKGLAISITLGTRPRSHLRYGLRATIGDHHSVSAPQ